MSMMIYEGRALQSIQLHTVPNTGVEVMDEYTEFTAVVFILLGTVYAWLNA